MTTARDLFDAVESHALATGEFNQVNTHEPKSKPDNGLTAGIWVQTIEPVAEGSGLAATTTRVEFMCRLYTSFIAEPADLIDPDLLDASLVLMKAYSGDFGLTIITADDVRMIDLLGAYGAPLAAQAGYVEQDGAIFRVVDITLPIIVNDLFTQAT